MNEQAQKQQKLKQVWMQVITAIHSDRTKLIRCGGLRGIVNCENLICAAGNHLFDDCPSDFGITEHEGHVIREHTQRIGNAGLYAYLHREFPDLIELDEPGYIRDYVNFQRKALNLLSIQY